MKAHILINMRAGRGRDMVSKIGKIDGIKHVSACWDGFTVFREKGQSEIPRQRRTLPEQGSKRFGGCAAYFLFAHGCGGVSGVNGTVSVWEHDGGIGAIEKRRKHKNLFKG